MDLSDTIEPKSDQLDAVDLLAGPRTFTITKVSKNGGDQPVDITLAEFDRVWRPGKSMRRVLVSCWGADASTYAGRRVTLYCDPTVQFGGEQVGGTRISHLSHIDRARTVPLLVTRGRSAMFRVQPLAEAPPTSPEVSLELRADEAVAAFARGEVTEQQLEQRVGRPREQWTAADVDALQVLYDQLKAKAITKAEAFPDPALATDPQVPVDPPADDLPPEEIDPTLAPDWPGAGGGGGHGLMRRDPQDEAEDRADHDLGDGRLIGDAEADALVGEGRYLDSIYGKDA